MIRFKKKCVFKKLSKYQKSKPILLVNRLFTEHYALWYIMKHSDGRMIRVGDIDLNRFQRQTARRSC